VHISHTSITPKICGIAHDATAQFVNFNRNEVLVLTTSTNDIPYGDARNTSNVVFSSITFDVSNNFDANSFVTLTVDDPTTGLVDSLGPISMTSGFFSLAAHQDDAAHGFTTLTASNAAYGYPAGSTFSHAAFGQLPDGTTLELQNVQLNNMLLAQAVLVSPTQDCVSDSF